MISHELLQLLPASPQQHNNEFRLEVERDGFAALVESLVKEQQLPLSLFYATDEVRAFGLHAILSLDNEKQWLRISTRLPKNDACYSSLTKSIMAAHWYERYAMDMFGLHADDHPDPRRLVHHENIPEGTFPLRKDFAWNTKLEKADVAYPMHHVEGEGIFEIPVGPIHAGIIEPGHFRFNVAGERIITLEGKLFFTHKGVEKLLENKTPQEAMPFVEQISGDMSASHALAFCQAIETICQTQVSNRAKVIRSFLCELERITMHIHDLSNIAGMGTGYTLMAAQGFRIKERLMRLSQQVLGNRFWRGVIIPGGVTKEFLKEEIAMIRDTAQNCVKEMQKLVDMAMQSDGLRERLETTGILKNDAALAYGAVGLPARASGVIRDVRVGHPYAAYEQLPMHVVHGVDGDVYARYRCRVAELEISLQMILAALDLNYGEQTMTSIEMKDGFALGAVESWRGEILTAVHLKNGRIERIFPRDSSFCNWALFGELGPGNIVPDFPLCNKSLNLSYSGNDL